MTGIKTEGKLFLKKKCRNQQLYARRPSGRPLSRGLSVVRENVRLKCFVPLNHGAAVPARSGFTFTIRRDEGRPTGRQPQNQSTV